MNALTPEQIALGLKLLQERGLLHAPPRSQPSEDGPIPLILSEQFP